VSSPGAGRGVRSRAGACGARKWTCATCPATNQLVFGVFSTNQLVFCVFYGRSTHGRVLSRNPINLRSGQLTQQFELPCLSLPMAYSCIPPPSVFDFCFLFCFSPHLVTRTLAAVAAFLFEHHTTAIRALPHYRTLLVSSDNQWYGSLVFLPGREALGSLGLARSWHFENHFRLGPRRGPRRILRLVKHRLPDAVQLGLLGWLWDCKGQ